MGEFSGKYYSSRWLEFGLTCHPNRRKGRKEGTYRKTNDFLTAEEQKRHIQKNK